MPKPLLERIGKAELEYRLRHVHDLTRDADAIKNPAASRHLTAHARKVRDAMTYLEHAAEKSRLAKGRDNASKQGNLELISAYFDALRRLDVEHPQAPDIGTFLYRITEVTPLGEPEKQAGSGAMLYKGQRAKVQKIVERQMEQHTQRLRRAEAKLRAEIADMQAHARPPVKPGTARPGANPEAERFDRLADTVADPELRTYYRERAVKARKGHSYGSRGYRQGKTRRGSQTFAYEAGRL
jgi:hypothetical protein